LDAAAINLQAMGRNTAIDWLPHYREVLVATAVRAVRERFPAIQAYAFALESRAWLTQPAEQTGWRAAAIAAGAVPQPVTR
jgi:hypothetical protein